MNESKKYIAGVLKLNKRIDGRGLLDYRKPITIETDISNKAEGSARVKIGNTEVAVGVKLSVGTPFPDSPDKGILMVGAELSPISSPDFEPGPPNKRAIELARIIDRGIRESKAIELDKLCITPEEKVWMVFIDIYIINNEGNLIDAAALAAISALLNAKMPKYEDDKVKFGEWTNKKLPVKEIPVACTFSKIDGKLFVDSSLDEEDARDARLTVITTDKSINAMQKGGDGSFKQEEVLTIVEEAFKKTKELRELVKKVK